MVITRSILIGRDDLRLHALCGRGLLDLAAPFVPHRAHWARQKMASGFQATTPPTSPPRARTSFSPTIPSSLIVVAWGGVRARCASSARRGRGELSAVAALGQVVAASAPAAAQSSSGPDGVRQWGMPQMPSIISKHKTQDIYVIYTQRISRFRHNSGIPVFVM